jgi:hypothetical protein
LTSGALIEAALSTTDFLRDCPDALWGTQKKQKQKNHKKVLLMKAPLRCSKPFEFLPDALASKVLKEDAFPVLHIPQEKARTLQAQDLGS